MDLKPGDTLTMKAETLNDLCVALAAMGAISMAAEALKQHGPVMGVSPDDVITAVDRAKASMLIQPS